MERMITMAGAICKSGKCNFQSEDGHEKFCPICGDPMVKECPKCQTPLEFLTQKCCSQCGTRLKDEPPSLLEEFNKISL
jgi:predicted amidophosphoribosyltransferase